MTTILLFLCIVLSAYEGLRDAWERASNDCTPFDHDRLGFALWCWIGLMGWWIWKAPEGTDWWQLPLAVLAVGGAVFFLCTLGTTLIHPGRLGLSSSHARRNGVAAGLQDPVCGPHIDTPRDARALVLSHVHTPTRDHGDDAVQDDADIEPSASRDLVVVEHAGPSDLSGPSGPSHAQTGDVLQIVGGARGRVAWVSLLCVVVLLGIFDALLPGEGPIRLQAAYAMLGVVGAAVVLLAKVLFRPWGAFRGHPNREDGEAFCLLVMMVCFALYVHLLPLDHDHQMFAGGMAFLLTAVVLVFLLASWIMKARRNWAQMSATLLYVVGLPFFLVACVTLGAKPETHAPAPVMSAAQEQAK